MGPKGTTAHIPHNHLFTRCWSTLPRLFHISDFLDNGPMPTLQRKQGTEMWVFLSSDLHTNAHLPLVLTLSGVEEAVFSCWWLTISCMILTLSDCLWFIVSYLNTPKYLPFSILCTRISKVFLHIKKKKTFWNGDIVDEEDPSLTLHTLFSPPSCSHFHSWKNHEF